MAEPDYRERLETAFGRPSNAAWGSAVFFETDIEDGELSSRAIQYYRNFVGDLWQRFGEAAWMSGWALVLARRGSGDIVKELEQSDNRAVRTGAEMLLRVPDTEADRIAALRATFDDPAVTLVEVYAAGDGGAYSGLMVAGRRTNGEATLLVFLMD